MRKFVRYVRKGWSCMSRFDKTISVLLGIVSFLNLILFFRPNNQYETYPLVTAMAAAALLVNMFDKTILRDSELTAWAERNFYRSMWLEILRCCEKSHSDKGERLMNEQTFEQKLALASLRRHAAGNKVSRAGMEAMLAAGYITPEREITREGAAALTRK